MSRICHWVSWPEMSFDRRGPTRHEPRLRFRGYGSRDSVAWRNAHDGARQYAMGCVKRIRNLTVHHPRNSEPNSTEALEILGALSTLARWVTEAEVVRVEVKHPFGPDGADFRYR